MNQMHVSPITDKMLRSFVSTAQAGSFTAAAASLGIGQSAVSHAVAKLEEQLGYAVFRRGRDGVVLTPLGHQLHDRIAGAYADIDGAVRLALRPELASTVTLSVSTSFASYWLLPRLADFKREHPDVELRLITNDSDANLGADDADLWIPLGAPERGDLEATMLCEEVLVPVAAPSLAASLVDTAPADLRAAPLIHLEERYAPRFSWEKWFAHHDVEPQSEPAAYRTNDYSLVVQAAIEGQGVALGWMHIVRTLLEQGRLVALGGEVRTDNPFRILTRRAEPLSPAAQALSAWLRSSVL